LTEQGIFPSELESIGIGRALDSIAKIEPCRCCRMMMGAVLKWDNSGTSLALATFFRYSGFSFLRHV
jgi:hypothetical protein